MGQYHLFESIVIFSACLVGGVFWLRASETHVSKGFAIFFIICMAFMIIMFMYGMVKLMFKK
jgi:hypothetical protein